MVPSDIGVNDLLNGHERPVEFDVKETKRKLQIIQSLAKWKRIALKRYGFKPGEGLFGIEPKDINISDFTHDRKYLKKIIKWPNY